MSDPLRTAEDYELFLYTLSDVFPSIRHSTLTFIRRGASLARVAGELHFDQGVRLVVRERLTFSRLPATLESYGYEVWRGEEKLYWYDPQPHPDESALQSTYPHHKHLPPNIKHNRIPALEMSFSRSNFPFLIEEIEELVRRLSSDPH
jgi:hypothetical protein